MWVLVLFAPVSARPAQSLPAAHLYEAHLHQEIARGAGEEEDAVILYCTAILKSRFDGSASRSLESAISARALGPGN